MLLSLPKGQPSPVFSRIRALVIAWAELLPALIICLSRPFSPAVNRTANFSCTMDSHPLQHWLLT